jgi:DNA-binding beta-propeller fold protein YncE
MPHAQRRRSGFAALALLAALFAGCAATPDYSSGIPVFEIDPSWPLVPNQWKLGDVSSIGIDANDNAYVLHRPRTLHISLYPLAAPPILVFDSRGRFIRAWGGAGSGHEWPEREHGIHVDHRGYIWVGGNNCIGRSLPGLKEAGDDQLVKFTPEGRAVLQIGRSSQSKGNADTVNLHQPADVWVLPATNELFVADGYGNHRVAVFDADTGAFRRMWGAFGNAPVDKDECPPPSLKSVPPGKGSEQFSIVHAIRVANDGTVYVADRENRRVQMFTREGKFVKQLVRETAPFARNLALSPDAAQRFLYVGGGSDIVVVDRQTLEIVTTIELPGMVGGGHHIATDSRGNLYIAATARGMQKLTLVGFRPK